MNRDEYISELRSKLRGLREEDIEDAILYCEEYFEDAGVENEQSVIEELGTPTKYAAQIRADFAIRNNTQRQRVDTRSKNPHTSMKNIIVIFLGICALPLALPLALAVVLLFFAFMLVMVALMFAAVATVAAVLFSGIPLIISGFTNMANPGNAMVALGGGLLAIGLSLLLLVGLIKLISVLIPAFSRAITGIYHKAKGGKKYEKA